MDLVFSSDTESHEHPPPDVPTLDLTLAAKINSQQIGGDSLVCSTFATRCC